MLPRQIQDQLAANAARVAGLPVAGNVASRAAASAAAVPTIGGAIGDFAVAVPQIVAKQAGVAIPASGGSARSAGPTRAQTDPLTSSLASLDTILGNKNDSSRGEYNRAIDGYNEQDAADRQIYDKNIAQNETTLTGNNQAALLNAANASTGLRGVLASMRALGGSGIDIVKRLVGLAANTDTGAARDTFETNANSLNTSWSQAEREQRQRREDAAATLENSIQNNKSSVLTSRQSILQQLANLYGADNAQGQQYASEASSLAAPIAATTRATIAPYQKASSSFTPDSLKTYLAGIQNLDVSTGAADSPIINSPVFSGRRRDRLDGVA